MRSGEERVYFWMCERNVDMAEKGRRYGSADELYKL